MAQQNELLGHKKKRNMFLFRRSISRYHFTMDQHKILNPCQNFENSLIQLQHFLTTNKVFNDLYQCSLYQHQKQNSQNKQTSDDYFSKNAQNLQEQMNGYVFPQNQKNIKFFQEQILIPFLHYTLLNFVFLVHYTRILVGLPSIYRVHIYMNIMN